MMKTLKTLKFWRLRNQFSLKIQDDLKKLKKIYNGQAPTSVFDYDWNNLESSQKQVNLLKCAAALTARAMCDDADLKISLDINMISGLIDRISLPKQSAKTLTEVAQLQYRIHLVNTIGFELVHLDRLSIIRATVYDHIFSRIKSKFHQQMEHANYYRKIEVTTIISLADLADDRPHILKMQSAGRFDLHGKWSAFPTLARISVSKYGC